MLTCTSPIKISSCYQNSLCVVLLAIFTSSCLYNKYAPVEPLQGNYPEKIVWEESSMTFDRAFDRTIEFMTEQGIEIDELDRPNGIIKLSTSIPTSMITLEKNGQPGNKDVAIVISSTSAFITSLQGRVVILIRPKDERGSLIGARLIPSKKDNFTGEYIRTEIATLGNYEKYLLALITQKE